MQAKGADFGDVWARTIVMLDLHVHVLPGVDDGASDRHVTGRMLDHAKQLGFETLVATPHLLEPLSAAYQKRVEAALRETRRIAEPLGIDVLPGFEVLVTPDLPARLIQGEPITLAGSRAILLELPGTSWPPYADDILFKLQLAGFQPILAHPERYSRLCDDPPYAVELAQRGIHFQVTIATLAGVFGKRAQRFARTLVQANAVRLVATDAHSVGGRYEAVARGLEQLQALSSVQRVRQLTVDFPRSLIQDVAVPDLTTEPSPRRVRWMDRLHLSSRS